MKHKSLRSLLIAALVIAFVQPVLASKPELKCGPDGTFKVLMISDVQDGAKLDPRATAVMEKVLDEEKPNVVIIGGDCVAGYAINTPDELRSAIACVAAPMEKRNVPWAIVFGNHDMEHYPRTKISKDEVIKIYSRYLCNLNTRGDRRIHGNNTYLLVKSSNGKDPIFTLWLMDSNDYVPKEIGGYGWIHSDQVSWYVKTSESLEKKYKHKLPGIMYFHIPVREFGEMVKNTKIHGDRYEDEGSSKVNSGLFSAVLDRGDVKGMFCGHEHINNYIGEWMGIKLGYDASVGYASYNLPDNDPNSVRTRGGRVFLIKESDPWNFQTWMRFSDGTTDQAAVK